MRFSLLKILYPVHCLKLNMETGIRTQNHMELGGWEGAWMSQPCNTCELSKDDSELHKESFDHSETQNTFPLISFLKNILYLSRDSYHHDFLQMMSATPNNIWIQLLIYIKTSKCNSAAECLNAIFSPPESFPVTFSLKLVKSYWIMISMFRYKRNSHIVKTPVVLLWNKQCIWQWGWNKPSSNWTSISVKIIFNLKDGGNTKIQYAFTALALNSIKREIMFQRQ